MNRRVAYPTSRTSIIAGRRCVLPPDPRNRQLEDVLDASKFRAHWARGINQNHCASYGFNWEVASELDLFWPSRIFVA